MLLAAEASDIAPARLLSVRQAERAAPLNIEEQWSAGGLASNTPQLTLPMEERRPGQIPIKADAFLTRGERRSGRRGRSPLPRKLKVSEDIPRKL